MAKHELPPDLLQFTELSHDILHTLAGREFINNTKPALYLVFSHLHASNILKPGDQITIPIDSTCGFEGSVVLRVSSGGVCELDNVRPDAPAPQQDT